MKPLIIPPTSASRLEIYQYRMQYAQRQVRSLEQKLHSINVRYKRVHDLNSELKRQVRFYRNLLGADKMNQIETYLDQVKEQLTNERCGTDRTNPGELSGRSECMSAADC